MENIAIGSRHIFLCQAALTAATIEFGGLSCYVADPVAVVVESYRRHISLAERKANDDGFCRWLVFRDYLSAYS